MLSRIFTRLMITLATVGLLICVGCSDDNTTAPGGDTPPGDVTAPLVIDLSPANLDNGVSVDQNITVVFNEAVDQATFAAALTLSAGTVTGIVWNAAGTSAEVSHLAWAEGVTVTVTVGAGVTDLAGNALPQAFSSEFYTYASAPVMVGYDFYAPLDTVPLTGFFDINFSRPMDRTSILGAYTLTMDPPVAKDLPGIIIGSVDGDNSRVRIRWDGTLVPHSTYHFGISIAAQTVVGESLSAPVAIDFTTGTEIDETMPYIVSTSPALDSVVSPDVTSITVTFNERIDQSNTTPSAMAGLLSVYMAREPVWNEAGDELTVYLVNPLPAGIRFYVIWDEGDFKDMAGLGNANQDSLSFSTSGPADLFPVRDDLRVYYRYEGKKILARLMRQTFENIVGDDFERVVNRFTATGYDELEEHSYMSKSGLNVMFRGFQEDQQDVMFDPAINYLPSPLPDTWSGSTTIAAPEGTVNLNYTGTFIETYRDRISEPGKVVNTYLYLDNCVEVTIYHEMIPAGTTSVTEDGTDTLYLCPGLGIIAMDSSGHQYDGETIVDSWDDSYWLWAAALDGRYEELQ